MSSGVNNAKPFVKWVGGKGQLLTQLSMLLPTKFTSQYVFDYYEPFVGGGAMLFFILKKFPSIKSATINDINSELMTTYRVVRDNPNELIGLLKELQSRYTELATTSEKKDFFIDKRAEYNTYCLSEVEMSALFIFLNRTCFNGLYRVNSKGLYNVPFGKYTNPSICDQETILADSQLLQKVEILNGDFECRMNTMVRDTFVYLDPPYRPLTQTASFTAYAKSGFNDDEQKRLASYCRYLDEIGCQWLLSNSDPRNTDLEDNFFDELYMDFEVHRVTANRMINSKADGRGKIYELAIRNYGE